MTNTLNSCSHQVFHPKRAHVYTKNKPRVVLFGFTEVPQEFPQTPF